MDTKFGVIGVVLISLSLFWATEIYHSKSDNMRRVCSAADRILINPIYDLSIPQDLSLFSGEIFKKTSEQQERYERLKFLSELTITEHPDYFTGEDIEFVRFTSNEDTLFAFEEMDESFEYFKKICDVESNINVLTWLERSSSLVSRVESLLAEDKANSLSIDSEKWIYLNQVGAFDNELEAIELMSKIKVLKMPVEKHVVKEKWHRVLVGPYLDEKAVSNARKILSENGLESLLIRRKVEQD
jgi:hypothetical protein